MKTRSLATKISLNCPVLPDRLVDILNECSLHPHDAAGLLALYKAAKKRNVTTAAILSDLALEHAESASEKDKLAIATGNFVPPAVEGLDTSARQSSRDEAEQQTAAAAAPDSSGMPKEAYERALLHSKETY